MFYLKWAIKNLHKNLARSIGMLVLIIVSSIVLFLSFSFCVGSQQQMRESLRSYVGDINIRAINDKNLDEIRNYLPRMPYYDEIESIIETYRIRCDLISNYSSTQGLVVGASSNYFHRLATQVDWIAGDHSLKKRETVLEKGYAKQLGVEVGDDISVVYVTSRGAINTGNFKVHGIFTGNKYEHSNKIYVLLNEASELAMKVNMIDQLIIFLKTPEDDLITQQIVDDMKSFSHTINLNVWRWNPLGHIFVKIFQYARVFLKIIISIVIVVLLTILFFGLQNSFYLIFNDRANEISVLATYGMTFKQFYQLVFWETIILGIMGILLGFALSLLGSNLLSNLKVSTISDEIVVILGGANLIFNFTGKDFCVVVLFILSVALLSTFYSINKYLRVEIREMQLGI